MLWSIVGFFLSFSFVSCFWVSHIYTLEDNACLKCVSVTSPFFVLFFSLFLGLDRVFLHVFVCVCAWEGMFCSQECAGDAVDGTGSIPRKRQVPDFKPRHNPSCAHIEYHAGSGRVRAEGPDGRSMIRGQGNEGKGKEAKREVRIWAQLE